MTRISRTFRIFVSSTFDDFWLERNALQSVVFRHLREHCEDNDCSFQAIDLRWGVSREASLDQKAVRVCLEEIRRCQGITPKPNFILFLGNRYGWRPLPEEIDSDEFKKIRDLCDEGGKANLRRWYQRDKNAIPSVYCLQQRTGEFADDQKWGRVERELHLILADRAKQLGLADEEMFKYLASATEQEIQKGVLGAESAREHVFAFFRNFPPGKIPADDDGKRFIDLVPLDSGKGPESFETDSDARDRLDDLKKRLRETLAGNVFEYDLTWAVPEPGPGPTSDDGPVRGEHAGPITDVYLERLCRDVEGSLRKIIDKQMDEQGWRKGTHPDPVRKEVEEQEAFAGERASFFTGRREVLQTIGAYIAGSEAGPLVIYGEGGTGKSALMAQTIRLARGELESGGLPVYAPLSGPEVVFRFIGATAESTDVRNLLEILCRQVARIYGDGGDPVIPTRFEDLVAELPRRLASATAQRPLVLLLDALDQLADAYHAGNLNWLPVELPEHVRLILTTRHGEGLVALRHRMSEGQFLELGPMPRAEAEDLLESWLDSVGRTLNDAQRSLILDSFAGTGTSQHPGGLPLYLKLAFEEGRRWKSYSQDVTLAPDIPGIINQLYSRLEKDHGKLMASRCLSYIAASRDRSGFAEDEIIDILSRDEEVFEEVRLLHQPPEQRLPVALWSRMYFDLEPYLGRKRVEKTALLNFYHREMGEVAFERYFGRDRRQWAGRNELLAGYFMEKADSERGAGEPAGEHKWQGPPRALAELPYHLANADMLDTLFDTMTDFVFLENKAQRVSVGEFEDARGGKAKVYNGVFALLRDYEQSLQAYDAALDLEQGAAGSGGS